MSSTSDRTRIVLQEAAYWYIRCFDERAMRRSDRELFVAWLKRSPENIAEFLRIAEMDGKFAGQKLLDSASDLEESNVVDIGHGSSAAQYDYHPSETVSDKVPRKWSMWDVAAACATIALTMLLGFVAFNKNADDVVETVAAEWQHVTLPDGSTVHLDARTRLKVDFTPERRFVHLYHGWAVFDVAKDSRRPFTVSTDPIDVTAVGTKFGVAIENGVTTTVQEGIVEVTTRGRPDGSSVRLHEGQELHVPPVRLREGQERHVPSAETSMLSEQNIVPVDAKRKLLWVTGRVELVNTTMGEMVGQFNRRQEIQADIKDAALANRPIDLAIMQVDNVDDFVEIMESRGVTVTRNGSTLTLRAARME